MAWLQLYAAKLDMSVVGTSSSFNCQEPAFAVDKRCLRLSLSLFTVHKGSSDNACAAACSVASPSKRRIL